MEYGAYCECGEKGNESCKALTPRTSTPDADTVEKEPIASCPLQPNQGKYSHLSNKRGAWNKRGGVPKMENHQMWRG